MQVIRDKFIEASIIDDLGNVTHRTINALFVRQVITHSDGRVIIVMDNGEVLHVVHETDVTQQDINKDSLS